MCDKVPLYLQMYQLILPSRWQHLSFVWCLEKENNQTKKRKAEIVGYSTSSKCPVFYPLTQILEKWNLYGKVCFCFYSVDSICIAILCLLL